MPQISVILPIYNMEKYLGQCLDSILNQTLKDIEILCIDDGSTDKTPKILKEYAQKDKRIKIINQKNKGQGAARNIGIKRAKGEYIAFVDPDDLVKPDMYERLFDSALKYNVDVVYCDIEKFNENGFVKNTNTHNVFRKNDINVEPNSLFYFEDIKKICFIELPNYVYNKIFKRDFIIKNKIFFGNQRRAQDKIFSVKAKVLSKSNYYLAQNLYRYRMYDNSTSKAKPLEARQIYTEIYNFIKKRKLEQSMREQLDDFAAYMYFCEYKTIVKCDTKRFKEYAKLFLTKEQYSKFTELVKLYNKKMKKHPELKSSVCMYNFSHNSFYDRILEQHQYNKKNDLYKLRIIEKKSKNKIYDVICFLGIRISFRNKKKENSQPKS